MKKGYSGRSFPDVAVDNKAPPGICQGLIPLILTCPILAEFDLLSDTDIRIHVGLTHCINETYDEYPTAFAFSGCPGRPSAVNGL